MASPDEYDDVPMLPVSDTSSASRKRPFTSRSGSISLANTSSVVLGYTDPVGTQRRPPLVQMSDPLPSTRSPEPPFSLPPGGSSDSVGASSSQPERNLAYNCKASQIPTPRVSATSDSTLHNALDDDAKGWARRFATSVDKYLPIRKPDSEFAENWTKIFVFSCLLSIFVDPLFFFSIEVDHKYKCIQINWPFAYVLVAVRSLTDVLFGVNILLKFRWAYIAPESTVVGGGQLVEDPIKIASRYYRGNFFLDFLLVLPVPQIMILGIIPHTLGPSTADDLKNALRIAVLFQCIPKLYRIFPLLAGQRPTGFIFESALANFFINLVAFMLAGHVVGSFWYLFGLQRVNHCLRNACIFYNGGCKQLIVCGREKRVQVLNAWAGAVRSNACFQEDGFPYGVYLKAVNLTHTYDLFTRYSYSLFWGFQQISTLAGNQVPSYYFGDVLFTMIIIGVGLLLFALLIGNMQNFLLGLGSRNMEMILRRRDVKQWMSHRLLPEDIIKRVQDAEKFNWTATRGVNEQMLFENMPDDIQRDIRRHLLGFLKKVKIFSKMEEPILDAIRERLKQKTYLKGSMVLNHGDIVKEMVFIVRGKMKSIGEDGSRTTLSEDDVYGEELLTWCERSSLNPDGTRIRMPSKGLRSNRDVCCMTNVEAFSLSVADLEDVVSLFSTLEIPNES